MADKTLFGRLKRLFSNNVIVRRVGKDKLRVIDNDHLQSSGNMNTTRYIDRFTRLHGIKPQMSTYNNNYNYFSSKIELYTDYEMMDMDSILSSALDIYADECVLRDDSGHVLTITSENHKIQKILNNLFYDILNVDFNLWPWVRNTIKYGDFYLKLDIEDEIGVVNVIPQSSYEMIRKEGHDPKNPYLVQFQNMNFTGVVWENYEVAHFRLLSDSNFLPYGKSGLEGARKVWKQLTLMEDSMLIHRIMRAPERRVFKIDIGNIPPNEVDGYMKTVINSMKKVPYVNEQTGEYNLKFNLQNMLEDYYLPQRGGTGTTEIDTLPGMEWTGIEDINYLRNRLMAGLKIPKSFLGYEEDLCISPDTLVPLLSGEEKTVLQLISDYKNGIKNYVYSLDETTKKIVPGEVEFAGYTRMNTNVVRVHLDNGKYIDCTPDHNFLTRDGKWVEAQHLNGGQALMPFYTRKSTVKNISGYTEVYHPGEDTWEMVHRLVAKHYGIKKTGNVIHHIDLDKLNNNPENLDGSMGFFEHRNFHRELSKLGLHSKAMLEYRKSEQCRINCARGGRLGGLKSGKRLGEWVKLHGPTNKGVRTLQYHECKHCKTINYNKQYCNLTCWGDYHRGNTYNCKFNVVTFDKLIETANDSKSFRDLELKLNVTRNTLNRIFDKFDVDRHEFVDTYMPLSKHNIGFYNNFRKQYKNHTVSRVEVLLEKIDTCDITVKDYHNFATSAGVIIHNSGKASLAGEDVRFGRTIERIQRIIISELTKIAIVHLYAQGFDDEELIDFEISMTAPSIFYEQEKIIMLQSKVDLAGSMLEKKIWSSDKIYEEIFNMNPEQIRIEKDKIVADAKEAYRRTQISEQGEDPAKIEQTPQESDTEQTSSTDTEQETNSADTEQQTTTKEESVEVPEGGWPGAGRPKEPKKYGTNRGPGGFDPIGNKGMKSAYKVDTKESKQIKALNLTKSKVKRKSKTNLNDSVQKDIPKSILDESNLIIED